MAVLHPQKDVGVFGFLSNEEDPQASAAEDTKCAIYIDDVMGRLNQ